MCELPSVANHSPRILIVDDDAEMRRWLRAVLERRGGCVVEAASGWELLYWLADDEFDLVITDVRMPMPNGIGALSMVRAAGVTTPFLVISAFADAAVGTLVQRSARAALLDKPFDENDLLDRACCLMEPHPAGRGTEGRDVDR